MEVDGSFNFNDMSVVDLVRMIHDFNSTVDRITNLFHE